MKCKNPECGLDILIYKSSKRRYCDDSCKNRAAYLRRLEDWSHVIASNKAIEKNYRILKQLKGMFLGPIAEQTLKSHGFDFNHMHKDQFIYDDYSKRTSVSCIYDIKFSIVDGQLRFF